MLIRLKNIVFSFLLASCLIFIACSDDNDPGVPTTDLGISPASDANAGTSYTRASSVDIQINYVFDVISSDGNSGDLRDAVTYLDANGDNLTDVFIGTGEFLLDGEVDCLLGINNGDGTFTASTAEFNDNMPPATHARKSVTSDFNNDGLDDVVVFDHGFDANPFPGNQPKLIIQNATGSFTWSKLRDQTGFHHTGATADIDNDGDMDIFVGGSEAFFYVNDGNANFTFTEDRFDRSSRSVFSSELIDIDEDGFVDLIVGAHEQDGDATAIYWGSSTGAYVQSNRTILPSFTNYGTVLDFEAEDFDGDGDRDLAINRTGGGNSNFYVGRQLQLVRNEGNRTFTEATSQVSDSGSDFELWFPWYRATDIDQDGDIDLISDNAAVEVTFLNDGNGNFTKQ